MKTLKHISTFLLLVPLLASCHFLEVEKTGKTSIKNFYSDIYALDAAMNGVYGLTYKFYDSYMVLYPEVAGDLVRLQATTSEWRQQFDFISDESDETTAVGYIWKNGYEIIANANEVIQYGPSVSDRFPQQAASVRNYIAQAYFIRALIHLDLSLVYGQTYTYSADGSHLGTAVMTTIPDVKSKIARSTAAVTYKRILDDLRTASDMFADGWTKGCYYASPAACKALMARVYLYMGNYSEAKKCASEVIADYGLSLTPRSDYVAMFCARKEGTEAIFRLNGLSGGYKLGAMFDYNSPSMNPSSKLMDIFSSDEHAWAGTDIRSELLSYKSSGGDEFSGVCMKFTDTEDIDDTQKRYDPFVLRLSEMYLIRAEAACHDGDFATAVSDIATLEDRARGVQAYVINVV
uniref:RagB/SusD family nutrient uptake outer membrane protein n=1 Tax=Candidatus Cryptobacteroides bacterium TaxID=3085639 RepID=UPI003FEF0797